MCLALQSQAVSVNMIEYCKSPYIKEGIRSGRISKRIGLYRNEIDWSKIPETYGAEPVCNGSPVGGGKGYADIVTSGNYTVRNYAELKNALKKAGKGEIIFIPADAVIDFTGELTIPAGVTLAGDRGYRNSPGALLQSRGKTKIKILLKSGGDYIRFTGLRLKGPWGKCEPTAANSAGIMLSHFGAEVDNCEIFDFSVAGIHAVGSRSYIHNNHIHHNCRTGLGYGINAGGFPIIEANKFSFNRHHISSGGLPVSGRETRYNICTGNFTLRGYGDFDMHGFRESGKSTANMIGGCVWDAHHNTNLFNTGFLVRGIPSSCLRISHNLFLFKHLERLFTCCAPRNCALGSYSGFGAPWPSEWYNLKLGKNAFNVGRKIQIYNGRDLQKQATEQYEGTFRKILTRLNVRELQAALAQLDYLLADPAALYHQNCYDQIHFPDKLNLPPVNDKEKAIEEYISKAAVLKTRLQALMEVK